MVKLQARIDQKFWYFFVVLPEYIIPFGYAIQFSLNETTGYSVLRLKGYQVWYIQGNYLGLFLDL